MRAAELRDGYILCMYSTVHIYVCTYMYDTYGITDTMKKTVRKLNLAYFLLI